MLNIRISDNKFFHPLDIKKYQKRTNPHPVLPIYENNDRFQEALAQANIHPIKNGRSKNVLIEMKC